MKRWDLRSCRLLRSQQW